MFDITTDRLIIQFHSKFSFEYFEECKNQGDDSKAVIQVDFAGNEPLIAQNKILSVHWKERNVTV